MLTSGPVPESERHLPLDALRGFARLGILIHQLPAADDHRTTIFYGHGLGLFGSVSRTGQALVVLGVWALQLAASSLWMRHFEFGPFEWLWRTLTYGQAPPFRRAAALAAV